MIHRIRAWNPLAGRFFAGYEQRFTFGSATATLGIWSPDASQIVFGYNSGGEYDLYGKLASGVTDEELLLKSTITSSHQLVPRRTLPALSIVQSKLQKGDLWVLPLEGDKKPFAFQRSGFNSDNGQFSPDGRWVAYVSDESGRNEIMSGRSRRLLPRQPRIRAANG